MTGPVLETERLIMRPPVAGDVEAMIAFFASERACFVGGPKTRPDAWRLACVELAHWTLRGFGMWAVTLHGQDEALGLVGCWRPEGWPENELGWLMFDGAEGRGLAQEAARAARAHAYDALGWAAAVSYIDPQNARSIALAERLGCVRDSLAETPMGKECMVFRHPAPEALQ